MKVKFLKPFGTHVDESETGSVHLVGCLDTTACGIPDENWKTKPTNKKITCSQCLEMLAWARRVSKIKE